jgi:putative ABC transport system ATP-binding protein
MTAAVLEATDVVKVLGSGAAEVHALKGVSLSLTPGELTLLMGPSGSGKTTLLSVLGCMLTPTAGTVRVGGQSTAGARPEALARLRRENVGFVFQSYHLFPTLTALDNVRLAVDVRGEPAPSAIAKAKDALTTVGLAHKFESYPSELSGGEQQRVAIARAIVGNALVILADEPTAALDSENGHAIMEVLARIAKDPSRSVLVVTHDPRTVPFADRIVRIEDGLIVGETRPAEERAAEERAKEALAKEERARAERAKTEPAGEERVSTALASAEPVSAVPVDSVSAVPANDVRTEEPSVEARPAEERSAEVIPVKSRRKRKQVQR